MSRTTPSLRTTISAVAILAIAAVCSVAIRGNPPEPLSNPLELRAKNHTLSLTLHAGITSDGKNSFYFEGQPIAPTVRLSPGDQLKITYVNDLPAKPPETCLAGPCMDMTNLHFHGLTVSPDAPQDDVLDMKAMPGHSLHYTVQIPKDHPPGLYWYHTHPHGESYRQALNGMSGAIVIDGMERSDPEVRYMRERILVLRDRVIEENDPAASALRHRVQMPATGCSTSTEEPERIFTVNGVVRPQIAIAPGERQFWRIVNASPDLYADLQLDTEH